MTTHPEEAPRRSPWLPAGIALALIPINFGVMLLLGSAGRASFGGWLTLFIGIAVLQLVFGILALILGIRQRCRTGRGGIGAAVVGGLTAVGAVAGGIGGVFVAALAAGGAWGRPLRIRGRQIHPELCEGSDWTAGARPDPRELDAPTRRALEALWLHDAQKEHASVPAFARVSWLLAAAGAPADLLAWSHRAALEEIAHTQLCFALAAGYAGRSHSVEPMPELLLGGLDADGKLFALLATESLADGCQLEDFNADVAAACAEVCTEPSTRAVLERIAVEERSHAEFSWSVLAWVLERARGSVRPALEQALGRLGDIPRPTAVSSDKLALVAAADQEALRRHGRLPDARWGELWQDRLQETTRRMRHLLDSGRADRIARIPRPSPVPV